MDPAFGAQEAALPLPSLPLSDKKSTRRVHTSAKHVFSRTIVIIFIVTHVFVVSDILHLRNDMYDIKKRHICYIYNDKESSKKKILDPDCDSDQSKNLITSASSHSGYFLKIL